MIWSITLKTPPRASQKIELLNEWHAKCLLCESCPSTMRTQSSISESGLWPCYSDSWHKAPPHTSLWSPRWLSFRDSLNFLLLPSLQTWQPCREHKSFVSKSKIFIMHILKAKVLHHRALPRWGQGFTVPMTGMRTRRAKLKTISLRKWNSSKGTEGLAEHQRQTSP